MLWVLKRTVSMSRRYLQLYAEILVLVTHSYLEACRLTIAFTAFYIQLNSSEILSGAFFLSFFTLFFVKSYLEILSVSAKNIKRSL